ncbi:MAG: DMT family transporter [Defluviimonas sp.]|uniref:DMT family transporter n=1 Tax=Albidovulum sp. TaxID=1872424 RepID=UPI001DE95D14|nr:DMT family transporter [Paracoccaceae bacterium]MCC0063987.1 DMT family transporter [Defluviimonas sp.]
MNARAWFLLGLLALLWAGSFLSNRAALVEVGVLTTVAFRVAGGALALWLWIALRGLPVPRDPRLAGRFMIMGFLNNIIPFTLIVWGQTRVESGLASILNAATAIFAVLVAALVFDDERLTVDKAAGVALGFAGVALATGAGALLALDPRALGQIAVLGASLSYALAAAYARGAVRGLRPEVAAAGMLTAASLVMVPAALLVEGVPGLAYAPATWAALFYLAFMASALAYLLYYAVLQAAGAGNLSLVTLLIPPVAIALGAAVYHEALPLHAYGGFALLALGLLVLDGRLGWPGRRR